jgi:hypothetical protein
MNISVVGQAFDRVDPAMEPGVYTTMSSWGPYVTPGIPLWQGLRLSWRPLPCLGEPPEWCASFYFGPQDPRAKGDIRGDVVAGAIGYRDYQQLIQAYHEGDNFETGRHALLLAFTWGPVAFAAAGKLATATKLLATTDSLLASRLLADEGASLATGDASIITIQDYTKWAEWAENNPDLAHDAYLLRKGSTANEIRLLADTPAPSVSAARGLRVASTGDDAATISAIRDFHAPSAMFPNGGVNSLDRLGKMATQLDNAGENSAQVMDDLHVIRNKGGADKWLRDIEPRITSEKTTRGIPPAIHETHMLAGVERGQATKFNVDRATGRMVPGTLDPPPGFAFNSLDEEIRGTLKNGQEVRAQVDGVGSIDGKLAVYDPTVSRVYGRTNPDNFDPYDDLGLLERQAAAVETNGGGHVVWMPYKGGSSGFYDGIARIEKDYPRVMIHIIDTDTFQEIPWWMGR